MWDGHWIVICFLSSPSKILPLLRKQKKAQQKTTKVETLIHLTVDVTSDFVGIYINNLETEPPLRHFTDQTTEATISKFGPCVLYSIRMKMEIIKSVLIRGFFIEIKHFFFSISLVF